jgi:hypothetical protein
MKVPEHRRTRKRKQQIMRGRGGHVLSATLLRRFQLE